MQQINVVGTLRRGWRLLVVLAIVFAVVAVLLPQGGSTKTGKKNPTQTKLHWKAEAIVGSAPPGGSGYTAGGVTPAQLLFYANTSVVRSVAMSIAGVKVSPFAYGLYLSATITTQAALSTNTTAKAAGKTSKRAGSSGLVALTAMGKKGPEAVKLANGYASALGDYVNGIARKRAAAQAASSSSSTATTTVDTGYQVVAPALVAHKIKGQASSITSSRKVRGAIGLILGLLVAAAILLLREALDRHLRDAGGAERSFGYPVVIEIPSSEDDGDVIRPPTSVGAEAYRRLRMSMTFEHLAAATGGQDELATFFGRPADEVAPAPAQEIGRRQLVLVTSADGEPSRPKTAANLAASYAEAGQAVVILSTSELPNVPPGPGPVTAVRVTEAAVRGALAPTMLPGVQRLPLDGLIGTAGHLVTQAPSLFESLRAVADVAIVETPSLLEVHHAGALAGMVDVMVLVAQVDVTTSDDGTKSGELLQRLGAPVLGVVLTEVPVRTKRKRRSGNEAPAPEDPAGGEEITPRVETVSTAGTTPPTAPAPG